jgi:hypothetical protein
VSIPARAKQRVGTSWVADSQFIFIPWPIEESIFY